MGLASRVCRGTYKFDPESDTPSVAASAILNGDAAFEEVWKRFAEAPQLYPALYTIMRQAQARDLLTRQDRNPAVNDREEAALRKELGAAAGKPHHEACATLPSWRNTTACVALGSGRVLIGRR